MARRSKQSKRKKQINARRKNFERLLNVCSERAQEILRLASEGQTPEAIAEKLQVPGEKVAKFIDDFTNLPAGLDRQFLGAPYLLGEGERFRSLVKSTMRAAKTQRSRRPW